MLQRIENYDPYAYHNAPKVDGLNVVINKSVYQAYRFDMDKTKACNILQLQALRGGRGGIRTHGRLPYTAFRVRLVMTTSILFRISLLVLNKIHDYNEIVNI